MKKVFSLLLAVLLAFSVTACTPAQNSSSSTASGSGSAESEKDLLAQIKERGTLIIATEGNWSPWTYHNDADELVGLDVEIGKLIAEGLGVQAEFAETNWDSILSGVSAGRFDIACNGVGYSEERAKSYSFSDPYVYDRTVLVVHQDNTDIQSFEDLAGKTTTNSPNSLYAQKAESLGATVTYVDTLNETLAMVQDGRVDATLNAEVSVNDYLREHPDAPLKIVARGEGAPIAFPVMKDASTETLLAEINRILDEARKDGRLAAISIKYFGFDMTTPE